MTSSSERETLEQHISGHIFSASASLVGISLTCLGLFRIICGLIAYECL